MKYLGISASAANNVNYEVSLIIYRDQGGVNLSNPVTGIKVFNGDNDTIGFGFSLDLVSQQYLNFGDSCFMPDNLSVEEFIYKDTIELSLFSEGYYFAWETCCRNAAIINIDNPLSAGTTYKSGGSSQATFYNIYSCGGDASANQCSAGKNSISVLQSTVTVAN